MLEDKVLFRVALRELIVKIARAGKVDFNKKSTITLHLTFQDDLTEGNFNQPITDQFFIVHLTNKKLHLVKLYSE